ncbi:ABC transporter substrate-binding protein [Cryobacterium glaciale]|nr:ABC transporter substrate-binding protein [Cryobacterium glaciale]
MKCGKRISVGLAAVVVVALLAACSNPRAAPTGNGDGGLDVIRIGLPAAGYGPYLPVYAAEAEGYFKANGIKAEITVYQGGGAATEALSAGEADLISYNPAGVAVAQARGVDIQMVAAGLPTSAGWYIEVPTDSPAKSVADLAGKQVGIGNAGGTGEFFALWAAQQAGTTWENVSLGYGALNDSLVQGTVAAIVQLPSLSYALPVSGKARVLLDLGKAMDPTIPDGWVVPKSSAEDPHKADVIARTLKAIYAGVGKLQSDRGYALKQIEAQEKITGDQAVQEYENTIMALSTDGVIDPKWIQNALDLAHTAGLDRDVTLPPAKDIFTDAFAPAN